ncbi:MAG: PQQ-dependent sugar dehydrogenase, partial [Lentisphaeraceae bacterium]|nr:PQQ-dependent sugar dehydrogenase [Lentisphaeraceae bacterium]
MRKTLTILLVFTCTALFAERPGEKWIKSFRLAPDIQAELFADEDQLINPVAINFDLQNNLYVAESLRQGKGVSGSARKKFWAKDDFLIKTFADRYKLHQKYDAMVSMKSMTEVSDQLRVISDNNKDGIADNSRVISADYKELLSGAAAGVTIRDGFAYFTCIPNLYKVNLKSGESEVLASGFGIRIGVHGHDMHAPVWGMDGKLYFNIGDRGFDVKTKEGKHLYSPLQGGVFRCNPDGTQLELFHEGVRNPQGMQFDQFGNLFTVDNDMGAGDKCRVLFLGEGGDSGWNASNQIFRTFRNEFGLIQHKILPPWISEKLWMQPHENQPAWINPAAGHLTNGPSGMEYYPGSGFSAKYKDSFFICDHRGSAARSSIFSFKLEDSGAGFNMTNKETVVANLLASDVSFGYDG